MIMSFSFTCQKKTTADIKNNLKTLEVNIKWWTWITCWPLSSELEASSNCGSDMSTGWELGQGVSHVVICNDLIQRVIKICKPTSQFHVNTALYFIILIHFLKDMSLGSNTCPHTRLLRKNSTVIFCRSAFTHREQTVLSGDISHTTHQTTEKEFYCNILSVCFHTSWTDRA